MKLPTTHISDQSYRRWLLAIGHLFFLSYLAGTVVFYKERLLNFDSAYYTYDILINKTYFIKHDRWISYFTQWFPLQVGKHGGSLQAFLQTYSAAFAAWFYVLYLLVVYGFKNVTGGVFYALAMGLAIRYKYYAAISEITFSLALGAVLIAWLTSPHRPTRGISKPWFWLVAVVITVFLSGTHPVIIAPLLAFFAIDIAYHRRWWDGWYWGFIALLLLFYAYTFSRISANEYESSRIGMLATLGEIIKSPKDHFVYSVIRHYVRVEYPLALGFLGLLTIAMFWAKRWLSAGLFLLANLAWLLVNLATYSYLNDHVYIMIDGYLALFGIIWATPILFFLLRSRHRLLALLSVTILLVISGVRIYEKHHFYTDRLAMLQETMDHYAEKKIRFNLEDYNWHNMWYPYQIPHETLMLSALQGRKQTKTIFVNYDKFEEDYFEREDKQEFLQYHHSFPVGWLTQKYFDLPQGKYPLKKWAAWQQ